VHKDWHYLPAIIRIQLELKHKEHAEKLC
jgi:hypothetical protein